MQSRKVLYTFAFDAVTHRVIDEMRLITRSNIPLLVIDALILLLCIAGVEHCRQKADVRAELDVRYGRFDVDTVLVESVSGDETILQPGDILLSISGYRLLQLKDAEQVLDEHSPGDTISLYFQRDSIAHTAPYPLVHYYSTIDVITQGLGVLIFFALGLFVLSRKSRNQEARIFHHLVISVACVIAFTHGYIFIHPHGLGHVLRALLPASYAFIGIFVLHFSLVFPTAPALRRSHLLLLYAVPLISSLVAIYANYRMVMPLTLANANLYYVVHMLTKVIMVAGSMAGIIIMVLRFRKNRETNVRRQIAWIVLGIGFSILVYVGPWMLATSHRVHELLPPNINAVLEKIQIEESLLTLSLVLAASFMTIGIIRYRFFDIEFFFKRGTIVTTVIVLLMSVYSAILYGMISFTGAESGFNHYILSLTALLVILLLFLPLRSMIRKLVDRWFFRLEYNFREHLTRISDLIGRSVDERESARVLAAGIDNLMHVEGALVMLARDDGWLDVLGRAGFPQWRAARIKVHTNRIRSLPESPLAQTETVENMHGMLELDMPFARRFGIVLIMPIRRENNSVLGLLLLGNKRSETRYTEEDIDLLRTLCRQAGLQIERLQLQEILMMEKQEAAKLRELSQMKSYFVSGVSHDLKTPLTSIKLFAELLEQEMLEDDSTSRKHVSIIQGECDRLARLINNVLDFTKIERGTMQYSFAPLSITRVVRDAYDLMQYQFGMSGITCILHCDDGETMVEADADALIEAITNLLSNAIKYSSTDKRVEMRTRVVNDRVLIDIEDHGLGIAADDLDHLFEPFYRSTSDDVQKRGGVGLGLALVKHITDAHRGNIHVRSTPGEGSTFTLSLPRMETV